MSFVVWQIRTKFRYLARRPNLELFDSYEPDKTEINEKVLLLEQSALNNKKIINSEGAELSYTKSNFI